MAFSFFSIFKRNAAKFLYPLLRPHYSAAIQRYQYTDEQIKYIHILESLNYLKVAGNNGNLLPLTYFEFGCHSGRTFASAINAAHALKVPNINFFAFDSFQGLPATDPDFDGIFTQGSFSTSKHDFVKALKRYTDNMPTNLNIIEGFYSDSLTPALLDSLPSIGVVHIDVDLYSSCLDVLNFIKPLLCSGTVILFDDYYTFPAGSPMGEALALDEFLEANPHITFVPWKNYSSFGRSFFVKKTNN